MYINIPKRPTKEEIEKFKMQVNEDDIYCNYRIDLSSLDSASLSELVDLFKLNASVLEGKQHIVLTHSVEV